jgi:hypothetical protein
MECVNFDNQFLVDRIRSIITQLIDSGYQLDCISFFCSVLGELPIEIAQLRIRAIELCLSDISSDDPVVQLLRQRGVDVLI